jgi:hypothetical protein
VLTSAHANQQEPRLLSITATVLALWSTVWFDRVPVDFPVDTGAAVTVLGQSGAARIGTLAHPAQTALYRFDRSRMEAVVYRAPNVGTAHLGWLWLDIVVVRDDDALLPCLLGRDALSRQPLAFDWEARTVRPLP